MKMKQGTYENEIRGLSYVVLMFAILLFTPVLIVLNFVLQWEKWTLPFLVVAAGGAIAMHISGKPEKKQRVFIFCVFLITEVFYYSVNIETVYDITPVVILALFIVGMTQEKILTGTCVAVGIFGMVYHVIAEVTGGLRPDVSDVIRLIVHFFLICGAGVITEKLIDSQERLDRVFREHMLAAKEDSRSTGNFLANLSHEIRTPINAVIGLSDVCLEKSQDPELRETMLSVKEAGKRVSEQISDILDYSEIDTDTMVVNEEEFMLSSLMNDLCVSLKPYLKPEVELVIDVDAKVPSAMRTDVTKLKKILWHLIMNGIKYTKEGGVYVQVTSIRQEYGVNLCIVVKDTGIGISEANLDHIFEQFYQSDATRTRSSNGLGLGLSIVAGFVGALGGFCSVESRVGRGTTVRVSLPMGVTDDSECMSVGNSDQLNIAVYLQLDQFDNPNVREFYSSCMRNMVLGLHKNIHLVESAADLKELAESTDLTHLFISIDEYAEQTEYLESIAGRTDVYVIADAGFELPEDSRILVLEKPFYCFPIVNALNRSVRDMNPERRKLWLEGVRALVVDDEPMNLIVAESIFERYGIRTTTAASGQESIDLFRSQEFDIIFMDHMMPQMDGVEAMKRLRAEADRKRISVPIIALTANAISSAREMFISEGFDGFVSKPIDRIELERVMRSVLPRDLVSYREQVETKSGKKSPKGNDTEKKESGNGESGNAGSGKDSGNAESGKEETTLSRLAGLGLDTVKGLFYCQQDEDFYKVLLLQFEGEEKQKITESTKYLETEDMPNYAILVHALKSNSKMIGAMELSEKALGLEKASKNGDMEYVKEHHAETMEAYSVLAEGIRDVYGIKRDIGEKAVDTDDDEIIEFLPEGEESKDAADDEIMEFLPDDEK